MWRQHWDHDGSTDMMTHMMPFYSYDVPHTCGPDPKVCCQFDFARLPGNRITCPWKVAPKEIHAQNVAERAELLLDQYRKKAQLYKTNSVLIPLGDDFRYDSAKEWDLQFNNYQKIFDYVNSHPELNTEMQFATLEDYFTAVRSDSKALANPADTKTKDFFPSLSGDFFTYADRDDHYWSGYYTSRPFYKNLDRILQHYLRSAEIMYSMMWAEMEYVGSDFPEIADPLIEELVVARQNLALFQHHDGVTGTAKDHVVADYGTRMVESIKKLHNVMAHSAHYLLTPSKAFYKPALNTVWYDLDDYRENHDSLARQSVLQIESADEPSRVVFFNSHARRRSEVVTVKVSIPNIKVYKIHNIEGDDEEEIVQCQLTPVFDDQGQILNNEFYFSFLAQIKGMALETYHIQQLRPEEGDNPDLDVAHIRILNSAKHPFQVAPFEDAEVYEVGETFMLQNGYVRAEFDSNGFLQSVTTIDDKIKTDVKLQFMTYGTRARGDKSGAYLFFPDGEAQPIKLGNNPLVRIIEGKIVSYVEVQTPFFTHEVTLRSSPGTLDEQLNLGRTDFEIFIFFRT
jgi:alpha-mannosidase II